MQRRSLETQATGEGIVKREINPRNGSKHKAGCRDDVGRRWEGGDKRESGREEEEKGRIVLVCPTVVPLMSGRGARDQGGRLGGREVPVE